MDPAALDRFAADLARLRDELESERIRQLRALEGIRHARADASADDEHDPEGPTMSAEWSRVSGLSADLTSRIAETDAALGRIRNGSYGVCESCGDEIAPGRLEARPTAALCIRCASA